MTSPAAEPSGSAPSTGHHLVDEVLASLDDIRDLSPAEAYARLSAAHEQLHTLLTHPEATT